MGARRLVHINVIVGCAALIAAAGMVAVDAIRDDSPKPAATVSGTPPPQTAPPASDRSDEPDGPREFTMLMSGDVLLRETLWAQAADDAAGGGYDFRPTLAGVRSVVSAADVAICHMETPVGPADGPFSGYPVFSVPTQIVPALAWAGYDACTTASNHTMDMGEAGVSRTLAAMDAERIAHAGSARSATEAGRVTMVQVADGAVEPARVAVVSYTYGLNGLRPPAGKGWMVNVIDEEEILADAAQARAAGADVVVVALHWGVEYQEQPSREQRELARALLTSPDVDLVYGHHAHVVQPFEMINNKWVAYGLGNHLAEQATQPERTHVGVMARFTFTEGADGHWTTTGAEYLPTRVPLTPPFRLHDLSAERTNEADQRAYDRVSDVVGSLGAAEDGLQPAG